MSTVADLLADLLNPGAPPAKAANPAKSRTSIDSPADKGDCEGLRISANPQPQPIGAEPDSQTFASLSNPADTPQSKHSCGSSQLSQVSQGWPPTNGQARPYRLTQAEGAAAHAEPWNDAAIGRFVARVSMFLRRGLNAGDADDLAERLHLRDAQGDDRRLCLECRHLAGRLGAWRCGTHAAAGVGADLPRQLVTQPQRCPGFRNI